MTTEIILATTVYGTASGNYDGSSLDFDSDGVQAVGYYAGQGSIQTVNISFTGFQGIIRLQASLNDTLETALWFDVYTHTVPVPATDFHSESLIGNFVWIRAKVLDFESGTINSISVTY
jgi:hypothetical protein